MLFNIFINNLNLKSLSYLKTIFENESAEAINWLKQNNMLVNSKKFQVLFLSRKKEFITSDRNLKINSNSIISPNWVKLLGIKIDSRSNFEPHVSQLCKSAARQLNALLCLKPYLTFEARKIMIESFVYSNFDYCPLN